MHLPRPVVLLLLYYAWHILKRHSLNTFVSLKIFIHLGACGAKGQLVELSGTAVAESIGVSQFLERGKG